METRPVVIVGGGVAGLAAATQLGGAAIVVEKEAEPGGLVRSIRLGGWWFDEVLHLLYFDDPETERVVRAMIGSDLAACPPSAFVVTGAGTTRYPFQMHLGGLGPQTAEACVRDLVEQVAAVPREPPRNFQEMLLRTFGAAMCETFLFPYNRKMWKRPLDTLAPSGFQWNITRPDLDLVLAGAGKPDSDYRAYNARGFYPRPASDAPSRGMQLLSNALARNVADLRCGCRVVAIEPERKRVVFEQDGAERAIGWELACVSTMPLPLTLSLCSSVPSDIATQLTQLRSNRVVMVYLALEGPRPAGFGHWRYYGSEDISFNRLISMTEFDPEAAPAGGWGLMAELTEPSEAPAPDLSEVVSRVEAEARGLGAILPEHKLAASHARIVDPAYVVFPASGAEPVERVRDWLGRRGVVPLGRYGRWEYSSMAQCMRDGFTWGRAAAGRLGDIPPPPIAWDPDS
jgi:protoporphyrinogen oxidase